MNTNPNSNTTTEPTRIQKASLAKNWKHDLNMNTISNTKRLDEQHEFTERHGIDKQRIAGRTYAGEEQPSAAWLRAPNNQTTRPTKRLILQPACD